MPGSSGARKAEATPPPKAGRLAAARAVVREAARLKWHRATRERTAGCRRHLGQSSRGNQKSRPKAASQVRTRLSQHGNRQNGRMIPLRDRAKGRPPCYGVNGSTGAPAGSVFLSEPLSCTSSRRIW